jgi:hypothetical protein
MRQNGGMARPRTRESGRERERPVVSGGGAELSAESAREDLIAAEAGIPGNQSHLSAARHKLMRGTLELQAQRVLLRGLTKQFAKRPMEVERGPSGTVGERLQVPGSEDHVLNDAQKFVLAHRYIIDSAGSDA